MTPEHPSDPPRRLLTLEGGTASYTEEGTGPCIVAVHGLPGSAIDYRYLGGALASGVRFIRLEMPGFGGTDSRLSPPTTRDLSGFIQDVLEHLQLSKVVLLGHSFGTTQVVAAAVDDARVAGVALLAPVGLRPHRSFRSVGSPRLFATLLTHRLSRPMMLPVTRRIFRAMGFRRTTDAEIVRVMEILDGFSFRGHAEAVSRLSVPVFVAHCEDDSLVEREIVEDLAAVCPQGPRLLFDSGGHNLQKTRSVEIADALIPWIQTL